MNRQPRALLSVLLIGVIAFVGWRWWNGSRPDAEDGVEIVVSEAATRGGQLVASLRSEPRSFNRLVNREVPVDLYAALTGNRLVRVNRATQEVEPALAERWTESADHLTYTLTLRDDVKWSDGTPFTSADVLFTFQAIYDAKVDSLLASSLKIDGKPLIVTAPDANTVVVKLPRTFGPGHLAARQRAPGAETQARGRAQGRHLRAVDGCLNAPADLVSLGPFKLSSYAPGQRLVFDRNPLYWKKDAAGIQLPYLDQIVLEIVPDQNAELVRLQSGQFDMLQQQIRPEDIATLRPLEQQGKLKLLELGVSADADLFFFNLRSSYWDKDARRDWITRKEFRKAISHAIDREAFANTVYLGAGVPIWGPVTPGNQKWFSPNVPRYGYSLERSKEILAGIGLTNRDADPWLEDAAGNEARFNVITYRGNSSVERGSAILRDELAKIGIRVDVALLEQGALIQRMLKGDFESIMFIVNANQPRPGNEPGFLVELGVGAHLEHRPIEAGHRLGEGD